MMNFQELLPVAETEDFTRDIVGRFHGKSDDHAKKVAMTALGEGPSMVALGEGQTRLAMQNVSPRGYL